MRTTWPIVLCSMFVVSCTPTRDNPNDPRNAPAAALRIVGVPHVDGACPSTVTQWPEVFVASRGMCLALDATGTEDDTPDDQLTFRYELLDACGDTVGALAGSNETLILDRLLLQRCPLGIPLRFEVTAGDLAGGESRAAARIELANGRPTADAGPSRTFPIGGYPWSPGQPYEIQFSGRGSSDPDGDALTYCFRFDAEARVCSTDPESPLFRRQAGPGQAWVTAVLQVFDGDPDDQTLDATRLGSTVDKTVAYVREPNLWIASDSFYERVDGAYSVLPSPASGAYAMDFIPSPTAPKVVAAYATNVGTAPWPAATPMTTVLTGVANNLAALVADPSADRLWVVQNEVVDGAGSGCQTAPAGVDSTIRSYDLDTFVQQTCDHHFADPFLLSSYVAVDGSLWGAQLLDTSMTAVDSGGVAATVTDERRIVSGISIRPGTDEAWVLWSPDFYIGTGAVDASARLVRYAAGAPSVPVSVLELVDDYSFGFVWVDRDLAWITLGAEGLVLLDVAALELDPLLSVHDAIVRRVPNVVALFFVTVDPSSGALTFQDATTGSATRVTLDGAVIRYDQLGLFPLLADDGGYLWLIETGARRSLAPGPAAVAGVDVLNLPAGAFDERTGGVWVPVGIPSSIAHVAEDGSRIRTITRLLRGEPPQTTFVPLLFGLRAIPGTETLFGFMVNVAQTQTTGVLRIDARPADGPPRAYEILQAEAQDMLDLGANLYPTVPDATGTSYLWAVVDPSAPRVVTMTTAGVMVEEYLAIPGANWEAGVDKVVSALSPADNRLCFAFEDRSLGRVFLYSIPLSGAIPTPASIVIPANATVATVASSPGMCWVGFRNSSGTPGVTSIAGATNAGTITRTYSESGTNLSSFQPLSANEIWFSFKKDSDGTNNKARLSDYVGGTYMRRDAFAAKDSPVDTFFVGTGTRSVRQ